MSTNEKDYLSYEWDEFRDQMRQATKLLAKMNEAANAMRWQYPIEDDTAWEEFVRELYDAKGWLSSWCG